MFVRAPDVVSIEVRTMPTDRGRLIYWESDERTAATSSSSRSNAVDISLGDVV
jgi:translation initiation factor IF-1